MNTRRGAAAPSGQGLSAADERHALSGFEERLLAEFKMIIAEQAPAAEPGSRTQRGHAGARRAGAPRRVLRPRTVAGVTALASAAAVAIGLVVASGSPAPAGRTGHHGGVAAVSPGGVPSARAADVLHRAALAALQLPAGAPRPGQFVYSELIETSKFHGHEGRPHYQQKWLSADGLRFGRIILSGDPENISRGQRSDAKGRLQACRNGVYVPHEGSIGHCTIQGTAAYLPDMPTSQPALRVYMDKYFGGREDAGDVLTTIESLTTTDYLLPGQRAALYEFLASKPGLTVVRHVTNALGQVGIGVQAPYKGGEYTIIFDPRTYAALGMNWTITQGTNRVVARDGEALTRFGVVNKVGQLPPRRH